MSKFPLLSAFTLAAAVVAANAAQASIVSLQNVTASWINSVPSAPDVTVSGNSTTAPQARWGDPASPNTLQSGYNFAVASQPIDFTLSAPPSASATNLIGTFTHLNYPIYPPSLESITLRLVADVFVDAAKVGGQLSFDYGFTHWETTNDPDDHERGETCANGQPNDQGVNANGCADRVTLAWKTTSKDFLIDSSTYTLNVMGFSSDLAGLNPSVQFWTKEKFSNNAYIVGNVALRSEVEEGGGTPTGTAPEPGTLALIGMGLLGAAMARRRKSESA